ncbi:MAG: ABC transporter substrate-binding protein [Magnetococcales bacterium]|nr:ABC transporter substrate-binding protein [Magnetococcales bacterium]
MEYPPVGPPIVLGLMAPMTGLVRMYGPEIAMAGRIAAEEVNENGGVLGRPLHLVVEDDGGLPDVAVKAAEKLIEVHQCTAIIGNLLSNVRIAVAYRVAEPRRIPLLNFSFYEGNILNRYFFHFAALPNQQIAEMIPYMKRTFGPKMFFAGNNDEWPRGSIDAAKAVLSKVGGEVVGEEYLPPGVTQNGIDTLLDRIIQSGAQVFVPYFADTDQLLLLTRFAELGLKRRVTVVMGHYDERLASQLPREVRAGYYSCNTYFMTLDTEGNRSYLKRLASMPSIQGIWPQYNDIVTHFGAGAYLCVKAFAQAVRRAATPDPESLVEALETISVVGPQGTVCMDPTTHHARVNSYLSRCNPEGRFDIIENFGTIHPVIPERYNHLRMDFQNSRDEDIRLQARMLEHMTEGVCLVRSFDGIIVYANAGFDRMFAFDRGQTLGMTIQQTYAESNSSTGNVYRDIKEQVYRKGVWKGEIPSVKKDGTLFWCAVSIAVMAHAEHGEAWMAVYKDISESKRAEAQQIRCREELEERIRQRTEELEKARDAAEEGARTKERFLVNMSHEIRTPMNGVLGMADLLLQTSLSQQQRHYVETIHRSGWVLLSIINDILDLSKIQAGHETLEILRFDLSAVIQDTTRMFSQRAREKGLKFDVDMAPGIPVRLLGDPYHLSQIFFNLLGNAVKFTSQGSVTLRVDVLEEREADILLRFQIIDTGIGISKAFQKHLFQAFSQEDSSVVRRFGGTGLGLAITHRILGLMGGNLEVESVPGQGTKSWFSIRFGKQRPGDAQENATWQEFQEPSVNQDVCFRGHVLLVEDNHVNQEVAVATLESFGCRVTVANDGQEALTILSETAITFDVIFMDLEMPILDGIETTRRFRQWEQRMGRSQPVPIIALTAHVLPEVRRKCLVAGMNDYLSKPFRRADVGIILSRWLPKDDGSGPGERVKNPLSLDPPGNVASPSELLSQDNGDGDEDEANIPVLDHVALERILDLDRKGGGDLLVRMVGHYLEQTPKLLKQLEQALESRDSEGVRVAAHTLKSSSLIMGVWRLAHLGRAIERHHNHLDRVCQRFLPKGVPAFEEAREALKNLCVQHGEKKHHEHRE